MFCAFYINIQYQVKVSYRCNIQCYLYNVCACDQQYHYTHLYVSLSLCVPISMCPHLCPHLCVVVCVSPGFSVCPCQSYVSLCLCPQEVLPCTHMEIGTHRDVLSLCVPISVPISMCPHH